MESTVLCLHRICSIDRVKILNASTTNLVLHYSKRTRFTLFARVQTNCPALKQRKFIWKIYQVPNVKTTPDWSNTFSPPGIVKRNHTKIEVPGSSLDDGLYLFNFTVTLISSDTLERVEGSDAVFVQIGAGSLVAAIAGGRLQTVGFSSRWTLDGSASSDLDSAQPLEGLIFTWYCTRQRADYASMTLSGNGKCHPEQVDLKWTTSHDPVQVVQPETLQENAIYYFRLVVQKGSQTAQAEQMVRVQPSSGLVLDVTCLENCGRAVILTERFCLAGKCLNCKRLNSPQYHWSLFSENSTELHFDWDTQTTTGRTNSHICINAFSFVDIPEQSYSLVFKVSLWGDRSSVYHYLFFVNSPPLLGNCVLIPPMGTAFLTKFMIQCHGFNDQHLPLTYKVKASVDTLDFNRVSSTENSTFGTIVYFGHQPEIPPFFLPVGVPSKEYALTLYVEVYDALGAHSQISLQATVHGALKGKKSNDILKELYVLSHGPIALFLNSGDYFSAAYFVYLVASTLNNMEALQRLRSIKSKLREILLNRAVEIPATNITEANQLISSIFEITQETTEINRKSQLLAARKLKEVSKELKRHTNKDLGAKETKVLGTAILAGLSNILKASLSEHRNVHRKGIKETMYATEVLADLILHGKVPGENETIMEVKDCTITLKKDEKWDVANAFSKSKGSENVFYPKIKQEEGEELPEDAVVSTVLYEFDNNPFPWLPYRYDINTQVIGFKMTGSKSNGDMVMFVPSTVEIIMTRKDEKATILEIEIGHGRKLAEATGQFSFEVFRQSKNIFIQVVTKMKLTFQVFVYLGLQVNCPPIASFSVSHNKPSMPKVRNSIDSDCALQTPYIFCLPQTLLRSVFQNNSAEKLSISVVLQGELSIRSERTQLIGIRVFTADCLYLDGVDSLWEEGVCKLGPRTTWQKLHCVCPGKRRFSRMANPESEGSRNHIAFVAGKVMPYSELVETTMSHLIRIQKNPVTMLTILCIFIIYIFLSIWTMRKDRADVDSRVHVIVLPDNDPFDKMCYLLTIFTGSRLRAGTTADVFVQLVGERAASDVHCLKHPEHRTFSRGAIDTFLLTSKNDLGNIYCLRIWHNNAGSSPNWYLSRAKVENIFTKQCWMFMCRKWLSLDKKDSLIEKSFLFTHPIAPLNKMDFFLISFASDLIDHHLWLSIFAPVCTGSLNRLQKLSCCLAILLCILLFNMMFFSTDEDKQIFLEHPYLRTILFGFQGAFISIPLQMMVGALFKYSQNEPSRQIPAQVPSKEPSSFVSGSLRNWKEHLQKWYLMETTSKIRSDCSQKKSSNVPDSEALKWQQQKTIQWGQRAKSWTNCAIPEGDANIIAAEEDMPQDATSNKSFNNNSWEKNNNPRTKPQNIPIMLFPKRAQVNISWWNKYILWMLVSIISTLSSFFIILYGLPYDSDTSLEWLAASAISLLVSIFLFQPLNIAVFSALKTLFPTYCKSIEWTGKERLLEIKLDDTTMNADDMRELHYDLVRMRGTKRYHPVEEDKITIFKKRQKIQCQAFVFIKDVICHFIFLTLILNIAYSMENTTSFYYNQDIRNKISLGLTDVSKVEDIYTWLRNVFLPLIHNEKQPTYLLQTWSKILGWPRMRQVRAKNTTKECFYPHSFVNKFVISKSHCLHKYGLDEEDQRDYLGSWTKPENKSVSNKSSSFPGFTYQVATDPWKYSSYGELNTYGAGGYTFNFYTKGQLPNSTRGIDVLRSSSWLDENTWALIVEMTTFNSDVDLFCSISVIFEISHLGPINTTLSIHSYRLPIFKELSKREKFVYIAVGYMLVFYIIDEFSVVERQRLKYLKTVSNLINFGIKAVCFFFLLQLAFKFKLASSLIELYLLQPHEFIPFHKVSHVDQTLRITLGFLTFLIVLKTLRYSRFFYDVRLAQRSILAALPGICSMALVVAVYFFVYMAFGYLVFGQYEWNYNTMTHSAQTVFSYCVSAFKDTAFTSNRVLGGLFLATFMMVMICVLINLFQAVIMSAYEDMKQPVYEEPSDEAEVVNFLFHKIHRIWLFVTCRKASTADTELFNRVLFGHPERRSTRHLGLKARKINGRKMVYLVI